MSYNPKAFGGKLPTGEVFCRFTPCLPLPYTPSPLKFALSVEIVSPKKKGVVVPARQAYSHSASVGKRYCFFSFTRSFLMKSWQSFHETCSTGRFFSPWNLLGLF